VENKREQTGERARMAVLGLGGAAVAFAVFGGLSGRASSGSFEPLDAIPRSAFLAATVDLAELRRSPLYESLLGKEGPGAEPVRRALGVGGLAEGCGFDPMARVQRFAVSVPEDGERGEFGVAARVEVTRQELEKCTRALADKRGGRAETHDQGSFVVLEDASTRAAGASLPRLAYGKGGLLVVGKGTWFDAMLGAAEHTKPSLRDSQEHVALRASLTSHEGFRKPTILATAILPRALRERLKGEMGSEVGAQDPSSAIMAGVLGVGSVGVAMNTGGPGQNVDASIELVCDDGPACDAVEKLAQKKRGEWSRELTLRMVGLGPLLDSIELKREGLHLRVTASASAEALASTFERVMKLRPRPQARDPRRATDEKPADLVLPSRPAPSH
jgi:hypothetical protein